MFHLPAADSLQLKLQRNCSKSKSHPFKYKSNQINSQIIHVSQFSMLCIFANKCSNSNNYSCRTWHSADCLFPSVLDWDVEAQVSRVNTARSHSHKSRGVSHWTLSSGRGWTNEKPVSRSSDHSRPMRGLDSELGAGVGWCTREGQLVCLFIIYPLNRPIWGFYPNNLGETSTGRRVRNDYIRIIPGLSCGLNLSAVHNMQIHQAMTGSSAWIVNIITT